VERGEPTFKITTEQLISSLHSEEENYFDALEFVEGFSGGKFKWSPFVKNFLQLRLGHEWQKRDPLRRLFFPRSENGRWYWYRHLQKQQPLNFFRIDFGSSLDQPTLLQWLQPSAERFAAVLGQPILQSWSPSYHAEFFAKRKTSLYSIEVDERDLIDGGFEFLCELGLYAAAVTSPLKQWAGRFIGGQKPLNTLSKNFLTSDWEGASTDEIGFQHLLNNNSLMDLQNSPTMNVAIWGGGGVLPALKLPNAVAYSARTGFPREGEPLLKQIDVLVWAAGMQITDTLPKEWKPKFVIDLNYRADSPARAYAFAVGAKYISGEDMFFKQAIEQQKIWSSYE
jgi:shikimate 5-dehydrogenase